MKHPTQEQLLNTAIKLDDAYPTVAAMLVRMAEQAEQQAAEQVAVPQGCKLAPVEPTNLFETFEQFGEGWERLAWELCAEEHGEDACTDLLWDGGPIPEPWGDRWLKYEDEAKRLIALVRKCTTAAPTQQAAEQEPVAITEAMAFAFHSAITDGALGSDDLMDIMRGLEAAFAHITGLQAPTQQDGTNGVVALQPLREEQKAEMWLSATIDPCTHQSCYMRGVADTEAAHNITGSKT